MSTIISSSVSFTPIISHPQLKDASYIKAAITKFGTTEDDLPECMLYEDLSTLIDQMIQNQGKMVFKEEEGNKSKKSVVRLITLLGQEQNPLGVALFECSIKKKKSTETRKSTLWQLVINPSYKRKGYGSAMLAHIINFLCLKRISELNLNSTTEGLKLYFKAGMLPKRQFKELKNKDDTEMLKFWKNWHPLPYDKKISYFRFRHDHKLMVSQGIEVPHYLFLSLKDPLPVLTRCFLQAVLENKDYSQLLHLSGIEFPLPQPLSLGNRLANPSTNSSNSMNNVSQKSSAGAFLIGYPRFDIVGRENQNLQGLQSGFLQQSNKRQFFFLGEDPNLDSPLKKIKIDPNQMESSESSSTSQPFEEEPITKPLTEKEIDDFVASFFN